MSGHIKPEYRIHQYTYLLKEAVSMHKTLFEILFSVAVNWEDDVIKAAFKDYPKHAHKFHRSITHSTQSRDIRLIF
jgi:hypothetical protein